MGVGEAETYALKLRWALGQIAAELETWPPDRVDARPLASANSAGAIAAHVLGAVRAWVIGIGCDEPARRDRVAEFAAERFAAADLASRLRALAAECGEALATISSERLSERLTPPPSLYGKGQPQELSRREAIVSALQHAGVHLGELRLTRNLVADSHAPGRRS